MLVSRCAVGGRFSLRSAARLLPLMLAVMALTSAGIVVPASPTAARQQGQEDTAPRPRKKTRAQQIHDLAVLHQAHLRRARADMDSSQEYARRGDKVQAAALRMNADDSRRKAEGFKRQRDALLKGNRSRRR